MDPAPLARVRQRPRPIEEPPPIFTASQLLKEQEERARTMGSDLLPSGLYGFDWLLGGGLPTGEVIEFFGASGVGKTQLCLLASAAQALFTNGSVLYIDTSGQFSARRLMVLANAMASCGRLPRGSVEPRLQRQVKVLTTTTTLPDLCGELDALAEFLLRLRQDTAPAKVGGGAPTAGGGASTAGGGASTAGARAAPAEHEVAPADPFGWARDLRVIVVDSIFCACCGERVEEAETLAGAQLAMLGARLRDLARRHRLAVLVTNAARFESPSTRLGAPPTRARPPRPALGVAWSSTAHSRVFLRKSANGGRIVAQLVLHGLTSRQMPHTAVTEAKIYITFGPDGAVACAWSLSARQ